jgi:hypothetical protein
MSKFILQSIFFILIALTAITVLVIGTKKYAQSGLIVQTRPMVDKIIIGHSHPECAINDSLIEGLQNFSRSGESYFYTYYKLRPLLAQNPQIKTVFVEFSNDMISAEKDEWTWGRRYMTRLYPEYGVFIDAAGNDLLFRHNPRAFVDAQSLALQSTMMSLTHPHYNYAERLGKYIYLVRDQTDSLLKADTLDYVDRSSLFKLSSTNLGYLRKIIDYTRSMHRDIYLIRTPMHLRSPYRINENLFMKVYDSLFRDVKFMDYVNFPLENNEYGNLEHLNYRGARKFSEFFDKEVERIGKN